MRKSIGAVILFRNVAHSGISSAQESIPGIPELVFLSTVPNNMFNMEVTEALASCLLVTAQQCEMNQMNNLDSQQAILTGFQRCMHQIVQSALDRPRKFIVIMLS